MEMNNGKVSADTQNIAADIVHENELNSKLGKR